MKFAHLADIHLGGWKDPKLTELGQKAFREAIKTCIKKEVNFIILAGDLFNTAIPSIDVIKDATRVLKEAKDAGIPVYAIPGSHDYSAAGKTMLDVLEKAGLLVNVMQYKNENELDFIIDEKTGVKLAGFYGKKGGLEKFELQELNKENLEKEEGFKIFLFHTGVYEFMPSNLKEKMDSSPRNFLPKNFNYYAGGHIHYIFQHKEENMLLTFPGALFPNSFSELEEYKHGGLYIVNENLEYEWIGINLKEVEVIEVNAAGKTPTQITEEIYEKAKDIENKIVMLRIFGELGEGKPGDINFQRISERLDTAYTILRNTSKLKAKDYGEIEIQDKNIEELEEEILKEVEKEEDYDKLAHLLMQALNVEKLDGEKNQSFEERIIKEANGVFELDN